MAHGLPEGWERWKARTACKDSTDPPSIIILLTPSGCSLGEREEERERERERETERGLLPAAAPLSDPHLATTLPGDCTKLVTASRAVVSVVAHLTRQHKVDPGAYRTHSRSVLQPRPPSTIRTAGTSLQLAVSVSASPLAAECCAVGRLGLSRTHTPSSSRRARKKGNFSAA